MRTNKSGAASLVALHLKLFTPQQPSCLSPVWPAAILCGVVRGRTLRGRGVFAGLGNLAILSVFSRGFSEHDVAHNLM